MIPAGDSPTAKRAGKAGRVSRPAPKVRAVPAVSRSIAILRLLGRAREPMGVQTIAQTLGMVTSTCLHILRVLVSEELVKVDSAKRYSLGAGMLSLARSVIEGNSFPSAAQPVLDRISLQWSVTAIGVEIVGLDHMVVLALSHSKIPFRLHVDVGSRFPSLISATGRLVAAYSPRPWSEIQSRFRALRWHDPPTPAAWRKDLAKVRKQGYAIDRGNYIGGVTVLAAPVFNARGEITHTLVAAGVADQLNGARCAAIAGDMRDEAGRLSALLFPRP
jgi:DNA-binding IclR family transcriptional regulator